MQGLFIQSCKFDNYYSASFKKIFLYFNWSMDNYNIVMGFAIHQYESAMGTHVS